MLSKTFQTLTNLCITDERFLKVTGKWDKDQLKLAQDFAMHLLTYFKIAFDLKIRIYIIVGLGPKAVKTYVKKITEK